MQRKANPYQCSHCSKVFSDNRDLIRNLQTHTGEKSYQCSQCDTAFSQNGSLTNHLKIHTGEKPYQCSDMPRLPSPIKSFDSQIMSF